MHGDEGDERNDLELSDEDVAAIIGGAQQDLHGPECDCRICRPAAGG